MDAVMNNISLALHQVKSSTIEDALGYLQSHESFEGLKVTKDQLEGIKTILAEFRDIVPAPKKKRMTKEEKAALAAEKESKDTPFANFMRAEKDRLKASNPDLKPKEIHERAMEAWKQQKDQLTESAKAAKKAESEAKKLAKKQELEAKKAEKAAEKEAAKLAKERERAEKKAAKEAEKAAKKAAKEAEKAAKAAAKAAKGKKTATPAPAPVAKPAVESESEADDESSESESEAESDNE
jgi:hypothetical protein